MKIIEITEKDKIVNISTAQKHVQFLQSWEWKEFQESVGRKTRVFGIEQDGRLVGYALGIVHKLPIKNYLYCPRGPLFVDDLSDEEKNIGYQTLLRHIKEHTKELGIIFLRMEPPETVIRKQEIEDAFFRSHVFFRRVHFMQPSDTTMLNLNQHESLLLKEMHNKTRYNIRLAKRKGVKTRISNDKDFDIFWNLLQQTAKRQKIATHPLEYYKKLLAATKNGLSSRLFIAEYEGTPLACNMVISYQDTAVYLHGGTSDQYRNLMAPHLLMWSAIKDAKERGLRYFDLYGIAPSYATEKHPLYSITRFKRGFGGIEVNYMGSFEFILLPFWYRVYGVAKRISRKGR
ncbi:MAG TPA: peptidoglycan bridge formation glycyltransferase FemA/FemB family protein [Patescibacteria group bacterium]|nr:peptidoglycan bridge formation glycyltransferase FemA/FemB family protein [Patescibacteria group bacterium]